MKRDELCDLFRANMRAIREELGISQSELARRLDVFPSYICDIENRRRPGLSLGTIADIAEGLGVAPATLISAAQATGAGNAKAAKAGVA